MTKLLYALSMSIAFSMELNEVNLPYFLKYIICILWILYGLYHAIRTHKIKKILVQYLIILLIPFIFIIIQVIFIWNLGDVSSTVTPDYYTRLYSNVLTNVITIIAVISSIYIFKEKALNLSFLALVLSTLLNTILVIQEYGINEFIKFLLTAWNVTSFEYGTIQHHISFAMEVHDVTFAFGFFFIYFVLYNKEKIQNKRLLLILSILGMYLGYKRIQIIAIVIALITSIILISRNNENKRIFYKMLIITFIMLIISFSYAIILKYNLLDILASKFNLDTMGRDNQYSYLVNLYEIKPFFSGTGYSYVNKLLSITRGAMNTSHTDIVRMYCELGFIGFIIWIIYYNFITPLLLSKISNIESGKLFFLFSVYLFITYITDNTLTLFTTQYIYYLIPLVIGYKNINLKLDKKERRGNQNESRDSYAKWN